MAEEMSAENSTTQTLPFGVEVGFKASSIPNLPDIPVSLRSFTRKNHHAGVNSSRVGRGFRTELDFWEIIHETIQDVGTGDGVNYYDKPRQEVARGSGAKAAIKEVSDDIKAKDWLGQAVLCRLCTILGKSHYETYYANAIWDERIAGFYDEKHAKIRSAILEYDPEMTNT